MKIKIYYINLAAAVYFQFGDNFKLYSKMLFSKYLIVLKLCYRIYICKMMNTCLFSITIVMFSIKLDCQLPVPWRTPPEPYRTVKLCTYVDSCFCPEVYMTLLTQKRHFTWLTLVKGCTLNLCTVLSYYIKMQNKNYSNEKSTSHHLLDMLHFIIKIFIIIHPCKSLRTNS